MAPDGLKRRPVDGEVEAAGQTHGPDHPQPVFGEPLMRVPDGPDQAPAQVFPAVHQVDDAILHRVVHHRVDGEVPSLDVLFQGAVTDVDGMAAVVVGTVATEGGDLERIAVHYHDHGAELRSDGNGVGKDALYRLGGGAGGDVVVFGRSAQKPVAHASTGQVGFVPGLAETLDDMESLVVL